jgi:hypothetical protein
MTDVPVSDTEAPAADQGAQGGPPNGGFRILTQYVRDLSFENPKAPESLRIEGKPAIRATFEARPKEREGRHIISNIIIDVHSPQRATGICYALLYSGNVDKPAEKFGLQAIPPQLVGEYYDEFVLTPAGWKFQVRKGRIIFSA